MGPETRRQGAGTERGGRGEPSARPEGRPGPAAPAPCARRPRAAEGAGCGATRTALVRVSALAEAAELPGPAGASRRPRFPFRWVETRGRRARSPARSGAGKRRQERVHNGAFHWEPVARCQD